MTDQDTVTVFNPGPCAVVIDDYVIAPGDHKDLQQIDAQNAINEGRLIVTGKPLDEPALSSARKTPQDASESPQDEPSKELG